MTHRFVHRILASAIALEIAMCVFPLATTAQEASEAQQAPADGRVVVTTSEFQLEARSDAGAIHREGNTIHVTSNAPHTEAWAIQIQCQPLSIPIKVGGTFCLQFEARAVLDGTDEVGEFHVLMAKNEEFRLINKADGFRTLSVSEDWHPYRVYFQADQDFGSAEVYVALQLATKKQQLEIRNLELLAFGNVDPSQLPATKLLYPGKNDESWRNKAAASIAKHRQANLTVQVIDPAGKPVRNATIKIQQQKHAYAFGTFVGNTPIQAGDDAMRFRQQTKQWFNRVTLPRYWADWGTDTKLGQVKADATAQWAVLEGFELKTHLLLYPQFIPDRVKKLADNPEQFRAEIEAAMDESLAATKDLPCVCWDAINELRDVPLVGDVLGTKYYASVFNRGNAAQPNVSWFINEYGIFTGGSRRKAFLETYSEQIEQIRRDGGAIEGIGIQGHFQDSLIPMTEVWTILDHLAEFGLPIEITEFDIDTRDEETQAAYTRDFLTAVFAHPSTTGFTTWGFWEGDMWRPNGAMFRKDWTMKPNGKVWEDLVLKQWWTSGTAKTDENGLVTLRAFKGTHKIKAEASGTIRMAEVELVGDQTLVMQLAIEE